MRFDDIPAPPEVEERTWHVVRGAFADRTPNPHPRRARPSAAVALVAVAVALAVTTAALSASGSGVISSIRRTIGVQHAATELVRLPAKGRLLVNASTGPWIVGADGTKRHLGGAAAAQASWSSHGLYEVVVLHRRQLAAIDGKGAIRWSLSRGVIRDPRWSLDGYRIAYLSSSSLRVVAGDGSGDHRLARNVAPVAPAWDGSSHRVAYVDRRGLIHLVDADTGATIWTADPGRRTTALAWEAGDRHLAVIGAHALTFADADSGAVTKRIPIGPGPHLLAVSPNGALAITARAKTGQTSVLYLEPRRAVEPVFHGAGAFNALAWSPNGRWLLVSWVSADQWVFIDIDPESRTATRVQAVSSIAAQFGSRQQPDVSGWCCSVVSP